MAGTWDAWGSLGSGSHSGGEAPMSSSTEGRGTRLPGPEVTLSSPPSVLVTATREARLGPSQMIQARGELHFKLVPSPCTWFKLVASLQSVPLGTAPPAPAH